MIEAEESELTAPRRPVKSEAAFRTISEVSEDLDVPQHVLRFWESKFTQIKPLKRGGGRRYYRPEDVQLLRRIRDLLYKDGYTIRGVQKLLRDQGKGGLDVKPEATGKSAEQTQIEAPFLADSAVRPQTAPKNGSAAAPQVPVSPRQGAAAPAQPAVQAPVRETAWVQAEQVVTAPARTSQDRAELLALLVELEELREILAAARRVGGAREKK